MEQGVSIFLDDQAGDERAHWVPDGWAWVTGVLGFQVLVEALIEEKVRIESISFDNDMGEGGEGVDAVKWLIEDHPELFGTEVDFGVHSMNPEAARLMNGKIAFARENWSELVEAKSRPNPWGEVER